MITQKTGLDASFKLKLFYKIGFTLINRSKFYLWPVIFHICPAALNQELKLCRNSICQIVVLEPKEKRNSKDPYSKQEPKLG